jgi:hypothetical protein
MAGTGRPLRPRGLPEWTGAGRAGGRTTSGVDAAFGNERPHPQVIASVVKPEVIVKP